MFGSPGVRSAQRVQQLELLNPKTDNADIDDAVGRQWRCADCDDGGLLWYHYYFFHLDLLTKTIIHLLLVPLQRCLVVALAAAASVAPAVAAPVAAFVVDADDD